ncbi:class I fructose-bisphosphate aldolase [Pseudonocardia sp. GCM10023141]|uniref:class I fructose-bisphosphate aldolase n=1 Tax=Pseudonocardia sp. GCM10023141 TaxID=3252653 RepID=UPI00361EDEEA
MDALRQRTRRIFAPGRGILGLDTAAATLATRFRDVALVPTRPTTDAYRAMVLDTPDLAATTSCVVLGPDDVADSHRVVPLLEAGILVGVRADTGCESLTGHDHDLVTSGLDGLAARLVRMRELGVTTAVWSVCAAATATTGSLRALTANSHAAARFAYTCQRLGIVPILRVGTRTTGASHARRRAVVGAALLSVCVALDELDVDIAATVISPSHEIDGLEHPPQSALALLPPQLGGVALAGGPSDAIAAVCAARPPWPVTFYLGQEATLPALRAWRGQAASVRAGQRALHAGLAVASHALAPPPHRAHRPHLTAVAHS